MDELWALTKHSINSDLNTPLNQLMRTLTAEEKTLINNVISKLDNSTYGLSALKSAINSVNSNTGEYLNRTYVPSDSNTLYTGLTSFPPYVARGKLILFGTWTPKYNGIVKVKFSARVSSHSMYAYATQLIGTECTNMTIAQRDAASYLTSLGDTISCPSYNGLPGSDDHVFTNIPVIKGIPLKIFIYTMDSIEESTVIDDCKICGTAVSM